MFLLFISNGVIERSSVTTFLYFFNLYIFTNFTRAKYVRCAFENASKISCFVLTLLNGLIKKLFNEKNLLLANLVINVFFFDILN